VQARLGQLTSRLSKLSSIDESQIPADRAGLGSTVEVVCQETKVTETYFLVFGDSDNFDDGHVTMMSPIGRSLLGKAVGDLVVLKLPTRTRKLKVVKLKTIHDE
jgi:transcription elongation factor GreA